jgi:hypothetical protein
MAMARKFDLNKAVADYCSEATQRGRNVELLDLVDHIAEISNRLEENVRKSVFPLMMTSMVRIEEEVFTNPKFFEFDVAMVDASIEKTLGRRDYLPICSFEPFEHFPPCGGGRSWNIFLFESFCLNFSERFKPLSLIFNKQCTGVIVYKEDARTFHDIAADMLARAASVELTVQGAVDYLKSNKMIGKAKYNRCDELLEDAAKIRKKLLTSR